MIDKDSIAFDVVDEETVRRLWFDDPDLLPHLQVDKAADMAYNKSRINSIVLSGILRGQSMDGMAFTLANLSKTNMSGALRSIRTAVTSAENGGRLSRLQAIEADGVTGLGKQWLATGDDRTRESHMAVNGEIVKPQERFSNGLLFPGDPNGAASEVYNCRCSVRTVLDGVNSESAAQYTEDAQSAFERWLKEKGKASKSSGKLKIGLQFFAKNSKDYPTVKLPEKEYAHVMSEIVTNLTEEQSESPTFFKNIGNYMYLIENNGGLSFRVIGRWKIKGRTYGRKNS